MRWTGTKPVLINRRQLLTGLAATGIFAGTGKTPALAQTHPFTEAQGLQLFASALRAPDGAYALAVFSEYGEILHQTILPGRGHSISVDRINKRLLSFARRPETFAVLVDLTSTHEPLVFSSPEDRHFYGHGVFSPDGRLVYAPENDFDNVRGVIGVYDVSGASVSRIGELESYGVGPHDLLLSPDGTTLVVANGGIETHPKTGREKLNLDHMVPSVAFINRHTGELQAQHTLSKGLHQLSLRHMSFDGNGDVWVGGQYQGNSDLIPPLMVHLGQDKAPTPLEMPPEIAKGLHNYVGSVEMNAAGDIIAASCPRGGKVLYWDVAKRSFIGTQTVLDVVALPLLMGQALLLRMVWGVYALVYRKISWQA